MNAMTRTVKLNRTQGSINITPGAPTTHAPPPAAPPTASETPPGIGHLTIAQAHSLYTQLHQLFGAKA